MTIWLDGLESGGENDDVLSVLCVTQICLCEYYTASGLERIQVALILPFNLAYLKTT